MIKATLKDGNEESDSQEGIEEDYPHIELEQLLDDLTLNDKNEENKEDIEEDY